MTMVASRIDDVLSKLRGAQGPQKELELSTTPEELHEQDEALEKMRQNLSQQETKERERKERRKNENLNKEQAAAAQAQTAKELAGPVELEGAPPARIGR